MKTVFKHKKDQSCSSWDLQGNEKKNVTSFYVGDSIKESSIF